MANEKKTDSDICSKCGKTRKAHVERQAGLHNFRMKKKEEASERGIILPIRHNCVEKDEPKCPQTVRCPDCGVIMEYLPDMTPQPYHRCRNCGWETVMFSKGKESPETSEPKCQTCGHDVNIHYDWQQIKEERNELRARIAEADKAITRAIDEIYEMGVPKVFVVSWRNPDGERVSERVQAREPHEAVYQVLREKLGLSVKEEDAHGQSQ
ncbi:MAG: hypothetical protein M0R66_01195 [Candidatus Omnitrophica bacterium]|nr:hypothetical protein [Candidatus Omnitrophota bacterium]